tara:strand:- start:211 stop:630 length:420 start_codon:yes stop_codon:yes gene_type:complete
MSDKIDLSDPNADPFEDRIDCLHEKQREARERFHALIFEREYLKLAIENCNHWREITKDVPDYDTVTVQMPAKVLRDLTRAAEFGQPLRVRQADIRAEIEEADDAHYSTIFDLGAAYAERRILEKGEFRHFASQAKNRD